MAGTSTAADRTCEGSVARRGDDPDDLYSCPAGKLLRDVDDVINKIDIIPRNEVNSEISSIHMFLSHWTLLSVVNRRRDRVRHGCTRSVC